MVNLLRAADLLRAVNLLRTSNLLRCALGGRSRLSCALAGELLSFGLARWLSSVAG